MILKMLIVMYFDEVLNKKNKIVIKTNVSHIRKCNGFCVMYHRLPKM